MEKRVIKAIIIVVILIIILLGAFIVIDLINKKIQKDERENTFNSLILEADMQLNEVYGFSENASFNNYINSYYDYIYNNNSEAVLAVLNSEYIKENNLNNENIFNNIEKVGKDQKYFSEKILELESSLSVRNYFVYGYITNDNTNITGNKERRNYVVNIDYSNQTFSVAPYGIIYEDYIIYKDSSVETKAKIDVDVLSKGIEKNDYNKAERIDMNEKEISEFYLKLFINNALYYVEDAYNSIDEKYREKRFNNLDVFIGYIDNNKEKLNNIKLSKYLVNEKDGYIQYIVLDNFGHYYIFNETSPMKYKVLLDYYTVDIDSFIDNYNNGNNVKKVGLNITKFLDMINNYDFQAAYNLLDSDFRNNNFGDINGFIDYVKSNFYDINKADFANFNDQTIYYTLDAKIQDYTTYVKNSSENVINKTFIVKLNDDGSCTMSFNK